MAALYIAQATTADLTIGQRLGLLAVILLTSKGAAGVAGGGFIALTATLFTLGTVPAAGIMLIFGIDEFMSECRALVNFTGNAAATHLDEVTDIDDDLTEYGANVGVPGQSWGVCRQFHGHRRPSVRGVSVPRAA
ncbi:Na+/H+-dicarboxylate symporter [Arthrobacter oryzae]|nr:Na+/H+-dicarboxylate symporter [Arthrobacter oryzae]